MFTFISFTSIAYLFLIYLEKIYICVDLYEHLHEYAMHYMSFLCVIYEDDMFLIWIIYHLLTHPPVQNVLFFMSLYFNLDHG